MSHRYKVREIAQQSGLSEATVDRVLNDSSRVSPGHRSGSLAPGRAESLGESTVGEKSVEPVGQGRRIGRNDQAASKTLVLLAHGREVVGHIRDPA